MRTTIRIDDELYREVKTSAARSGRTVAAVIEDAVHRGLNPPEQQIGGRYIVRPMGVSGLQPGVDLASNVSVREAMDEAHRSMHCIDVDVLVYAHRADLAQHADYRLLLERLANGNEPLRLSDAVLSGFVRVVTNRRVFASRSRLTRHGRSWTP